MSSMRLSQLFTKTSKNLPADEQAKNAQLLIRAGYIYKEMAGVYAYLPLGLRVLENIKQIIRTEMNAVGGQELAMTTLQAKATWEKTNRWNNDLVDIWFKTKMQDNTEIGLAWSHEEPIMQMIQQYVSSYRDLPLSVYQFQTKLRNELRAKSGIMRGREFLMKDMYSMHSTQDDLNNYYEKVKEAYMNIFNRLGIGKETFITFASGGSFTKFSHEFQTICDAGEDILYLHREKNVAINEEVLDEAIRELGVNKSELEKVKSAEVGNIFNFGTEKSEQMGIGFTGEDGKRQPIYLASYGIGVSRVMGVIVEKFSDEKGLVWPKQISPFDIYLVQIGDTAEETEKLYDKLSSQGVKVLLDDRDERPGTKLVDADLLGIPLRVVISPNVVALGKLELKRRTDGSTELISQNQLIKLLAN